MLADFKKISESHIGPCFSTICYIQEHLITSCIYALSLAIRKDIDNMGLVAYVIAGVLQSKKMSQLNISTK